MTSGARSKRKRQKGHEKLLPLRQMSIVYRGSELTSQGDVVVVSRGLDGLDVPADIVVLCPVVQVRYRGVRRIVGSEDGGGFFGFVGGVDVGNCRRGENG